MRVYYIHNGHSYVRVKLETLPLNKNLMIRIMEEEEEIEEKEDRPTPPNRAS